MHCNPIAQWKKQSMIQYVQKRYRDSKSYYRDFFFFFPHTSTSSAEPVLEVLETIVQRRIPQPGIFLQHLAEHLESKPN